MFSVIFLLGMFHLNNNKKGIQIPIQIGIQMHIQIQMPIQIQTSYVPGV